MPGRWFRRARFLDQHVVMKHLHAVGSHEICGNGSSGRVQNDAFELGNAGPVAIIVEEAPAFSIFQILGGVGSRVFHITGHPLAKGFDLVREEAFDKDNPDNSLSFRRVAGGTHWSPALLPDGMDAALRETATWAPPQLTTPGEDDRINTSLTYGFVFDYCGIEIDPDTGEIRIDKYVTMHAL